MREIGLLLQTIICGDELVQQPLLEHIAHSDHQAQCSDHVQTGIMCQQRKSGVM